MGYEIFNHKADLYQNLNIAGWMSLMALAYEFGWEPQGTVLMSWKDNKTGEIFPPVCIDPDRRKDGQWVKDDSWSGSYSSNDLQDITADDAKNFAEALAKALEYMSKIDISMIEAKEPLGDGYDTDSLDFDKYLIDTWSKPNTQQIIKGFIKLFKSGTCCIMQKSLGN